MKELKDYTTIDEVLSDARSEGVLRCVLCNYHIYSPPSAPAPKVYGRTPVTQEMMIDFLRSRGTAYFWQINRKFRSPFESVLRPLIESGRVIEEVPTHSRRGRKGLIYTWVA